MHFVNEVVIAQTVSYGKVNREKRGKLLDSAAGNHCGQRAAHRPRVSLIAY